MTSYAFNTMIGQVTGIAVEAVGWRYFVLFAVCNLTNAGFFYLVLPETKQLPLEEMNYLFTHSPWIVPGSDRAAYRAGLDELGGWKLYSGGEAPPGGWFEITFRPVPLN